MRRFSTALVLGLTGCVPEGVGTSDEVGVTESTESTSTSSTDESTSAETDEGGCPVGVEGCPCTDASTCYPGLDCVDDLCVPADPCPVGVSGCPCTNFGTCDPGSVCVDGVCQCTAGDLGCECLDGGCSDALDCVDGFCSIPELVSEAADGWGPVTCWGSRTDGASNSLCLAPRGDVAQTVVSACEVAERLLGGTWIRLDAWPDSGSKACAAGEALPVAEAPWSDAACFHMMAGGIRCMARIGHLWTEIVPQCAVPAMATLDPWLPITMEANPYGCEVQSGAPVDNDVDEWRCGPYPLSPDNDICAARRGNMWLLPRPPCVIDYFATMYDSIDWSPWACESAGD